jgi:bacillithiol biosynthesis deacetylase BshB1
MTKQEIKPLDILVFGAHPDDAEIGMGGTIAKQAAGGFRIGICDLTYAELSSNGTVETRQNEANLASNILGVSTRCCLGFPDRGLRNFDVMIERIVQQIRCSQPRVVCVPYWKDRHPDHIACSEAVQEAIFNAKLRRMYADWAPWNVQKTYFYYINNTYVPNLAVDVSDVYIQKQAALESYRSQFIMEGENLVPTLINQGYLENVERRDALLGATLGVKYAEGFATKIPHIVGSL